VTTPYNEEQRYVSYRHICFAKMDLMKPNHFISITYRASRKEVKSNDGLKDGRLSSTLGSQHSDSGQVDILGETNISQFILNNNKKISR